MCINLKTQASFAAVIILFASALTAGDGRTSEALTEDYFVKSGKSTGLINIKTIMPDARLDIRYAGKNNVTGAAVYEAAECWVHESLAMPLSRAAARLEKDGLKFLFWDCYRPAGLQAKLRSLAYVNGFKSLFKNPAKGFSNHTRGGAVDVSLTDLRGDKVPVPTDFDSMTSGDWPEEKICGAEAYANYKALKAAMKEAGFTSVPREWWHFNFKGAANLPPLDVSFAFLNGGKTEKKK